MKSSIVVAVILGAAFLIGITIGISSCNFEKGLALTVPDAAYLDTDPYDAGPDTASDTTVDTATDTDTDIPDGGDPDAG